jgi:predicted SAM-dependent methyltransferase
VTMKLYVGSRDFKPEGYHTVDIEPAMKPDFVADLRDLSVIPDDSCSEVIASAVLEHIDWPDGYLAISELVRVLHVGGTIKISVPDMASIARMLLAGDHDFRTIGLIYGCGGRTNPFEQHRYGYTPGMMIEILEALGTSDFTWWCSDLPDAANGWTPRRENKHIAESLNIAAVKKGPPVVPARRLYEALLRDPIGDFLGILATQKSDHGVASGEIATPRLYQRIHYELIDARQRIAFLEQEREKLLTQLRGPS